jgi:ectoine hydroxylase-related dioxygenase (phytanoyl-CoA dioxygenase family)
MKTKSFGVLNQQINSSELDQQTEELSLLGYTVIKDVLSSKELDEYRKRLDEVYIVQKNEFSENDLASINELNLARLLLAYDSHFVNFLTQKPIVDLLKKILGNYFILHLQNGIINTPKEGHHQNSWHRDLPYHDFTISKPLALSVLYCLDDFNESTGGTNVIPYTHKSDIMPSDTYIQNHSFQVTAKAGSVIVFDSMIFHKAGFNSSVQIRRGVNHMFTTPILKQQIIIN